MDKLTDTPLLKFNPNTLEEIRKDLNLHREDLKQIITSLENWIFKQNHFTQKVFDHHYLESLIIHTKGSLEKAKFTLDKLCTLKTLLPHFFSKYDAKKELLDTTGFIIHATMPKLLKNNYRLNMIKIVSSDFDSAMLLDYLRTAILVTEYMKRNDYFHGFTCVVDCRDINLVTLVTNINIIDLRNSMSIFIEGYCVRINAIHLISSSKTIGTLVALFKQVVSAKIANRITVHKTLESFQEHIIPKTIMPAEYGGDDKPLKEMHENFLNVLSSEENVSFFKEILKAGTDENNRLTVNYNDQILGMPGSFRTLTVD